MAKKLYLEIGHGTDVGCVRSENEDNYVACRPDNRQQRKHKGYLLLVCDGMGGALGGRTASKIAVEAISETFYRTEARNPTDALVFAVREANYRIHERSLADPQLRGMGTTAVALSILGNKAFLAHVGDSRCYLIRNGNISQLTSDHTVVNKMVQDGLLTEDEARNHPEGHILNRSVGVAENVEVDARKPIHLKADDRILLCTDGLTGLVDDKEILEIVDSNDSQRAVDKLIALAKDRGGHDNITVLVAAFRSKWIASTSTTTKTILRSALKQRKRVRGWLLTVLALLILALAAAVALWWARIIPRDTPGFDLLRYLIPPSTEQNTTETAGAPEGEGSKETSGQTGGADQPASETPQETKKRADEDSGPTQPGTESGPPEEEPPGR